MSIDDSTSTLVISRSDLRRLAQLARRRRLVEMQGYCGLGDEALVPVDLGARLAPAICLVWTAAATAATSAPALWALAPFAALGAVLPRHPFDSLASLLLRAWAGERALPRHGPPRRFACAVATVWLIAAAGCFEVGATAPGVGLGLALAATAAVPVTTGFCVPSWVYQRLRRISSRWSRS